MLHITTVFGALQQYEIMLTNKDEILSLAINNKDSSVLSIYNPARDETQEFKLTCK